MWSGMLTSLSAVLKYPQSVDLWMALLHKTMIQDLDKTKTQEGDKTITHEGDKSEVTKVFNTARNSLKEKSIPIWEAFMRYHILFSSDDVIRFYYGKVIEESFEIRKVPIIFCRVQ